MEQETKYLLYSYFGVRLYLTVEVKERRPRQNQTQVLLGLYGENSGVTTPVATGSSLLSVEDDPGGAARSFTFPTLCPQPGESLWLARNLQVAVNHAPDGTAAQIPIRWKWSIRRAGSQIPTGTYHIDLPALDLSTMPQIHTTQYYALGQTMHLTLNPCQPDLTHTLSYDIGGNTGMIAQGLSGEQDWRIPEELLTSLTSVLYAPASLICDTYRGEIFLGRKQCNFYLKPGEAGRMQGQEGWCRFVPESQSQIADGWGICIRGESRLRAQIDKTKIILSPGATWKEAALKVDGRPALGLNTLVLYDAGPYNLQVTATDSRGSTLTYREQITPYDYSAPTLVSANCFRCDVNGVADDAGSYLHTCFAPVYSAIDGRNGVQVTLRLYTPGGVLLKSMTVEDGGIYLGDLSAQTAYRAVLTVADALGNANTYSYIIPPQKVAFQIREGGDGAAFGGPSTEPDCLDIHWSRLRLGGEELLDYPIEQGQSGAWHYQKWRSGLALCWGAMAGTAQIDIPAGGMYRGIVQGPDFPFGFAETPLVQATPMEAGGSLWWVAAPEGEGSTNKAPSFMLLSPQSAAVDYRLAIFCTGRWK